MRAAVLLILTSIFVAACDTALTPEIAGLAGGTTGDSCSVQSVAVTPNLDTLHVGQTLQPSAQVQSCTTSQQEGVAWSSSDSTIATVDAASGFIQAIRAGRVTISASAVAEPSVIGSMALVVVSP